ncbi:flavodoxin family protein [Aminobacterium sp. UBA4908]|uniref:flavodoxin family protein n=1 Tax=Aminobacterium sp. UBA4908 TaxID=1946024 RepID=UPI00257C8D77|nr:MULTISPECIES: flavodoxin family protein [unclassified Aminobacterium]
MRLWAFNGSPRGSRGATAMMINTFLKGARRGGAETHAISLSEKVIHPCLGSLYCWTKTPGRCLLQDDMRLLLKCFVEADVVILATPLHFLGVTAIMKAFIDRLLPCFRPETSPDNPRVKLCFRDRKEPLPIVVMGSGSFSEEKSFHSLSSYMHVLAENIEGGHVALEIYRSQSDFLHQRSVEAADSVNRYLDALEEAGNSFALSGKIETDLKERLSMPLADGQTYSSYFYDYWTSIFQTNGVNGGR